MAEPSDLHALYGLPPVELAAPGAAVQVSPFIPGAKRLDDFPDACLEEATLLAPPGTIERRWALAQALRALKPGGRLTAMAPKDKGGSRLGKELAAFGCAVNETGKRHHRICVCERPAAPVGLEEAIAAGAPRFVERLQMWSQPGVFSWDRPDPGSALLLERLPALAGRGADFGCGIGYLARPILASPKVESLVLVDLDRRAVEMTRLNVEDPRAQVIQGDVRGELGLADLDFVVMNPPFHDGGAEDKALGQAFIRRAAEALKRGGTLWLVANRHLPYEAVLTPLFSRVRPDVETGGFKVYEARK